MLRHARGAMDIDIDKTLVFPTLQARFPTQAKLEGFLPKKLRRLAMVAPKHGLRLPVLIPSVFEDSLATESAAHCQRSIRLSNTIKSTSTPLLSIMCMILVFRSTCRFTWQHTSLQRRHRVNKRRPVSNEQCRRIASTLELRALDGFGTKVQSAPWPFWLTFLLQENSRPWVWFMPGSAHGALGWKICS